MHATGFAEPMGGLPDPEADRQFYEGVPVKRLVAWLIDLAITLMIGVPIAIFFGVATLGFGFTLFPMVVGAVGFLYSVATMTAGSATWGMWLVGIEFRRGDGTRFDGLTAVLHTAIYTLCFSVIVLQFISCVAILGTRYGQGIPDLILGTTAINRPGD